MKALSIWNDIVIDLPKNFNGFVTQKYLGGGQDAQA
jgi:hypothetical protein